MVKEYCYDYYRNNHLINLNPVHINFLIHYDELILLMVDALE